MQTLLWIAVVLCALGSFCSLLSPLFWGFDLVNHLRPQALAASVVLALLAMFGGRAILISAVAIVTGNAILFALPLLGAIGVAKPHPDATTLRILSANVLTANRSHGAVLDLIEQTDPDVVLLTEVNRRWIAALTPLHTKYPHRLPIPSADNFGMAAYAKRPFDGEIIAVGSYDLPIAILTFEGFTIFNAHPLPPVSAAGWLDNRDYLKVLTELADGLDGPVLVAGDLNTTLWGDNVAPLTDAGFRPLNGAGLEYTWPVGRPFLAMQIDHILGRGIVAAEFRALPAIGSDHFPVMADFVPR